MSADKTRAHYEAMATEAAAQELPLIVGHSYEAKRPAAIGFPPLINDRQIVWIGLTEVQYDSPSVAFGRRYPKVSHEAFRRWASHDVTDQMPDGEWRAALARVGSTP